MWTKYKTRKRDEHTASWTGCHACPHCASHRKPLLGQIPSSVCIVKKPLFPVSKCYGRIDKEMYFKAAENNGISEPFWYNVAEFFAPSQLAKSSKSSLCWIMHKAHTWNSIQRTCGSVQPGAFSWALPEQTKVEAVCWMKVELSLTTSNMGPFFFSIFLSRHCRVRLFSESCKKVLTWKCPRLFSV